MLLLLLLLLPEKPKLPEKKYYIDTNQIHLPKENMEIINPVKDGMSEYEEYSNWVLNDVIYLAELTFVKKFKKCTFKGILKSFWAVANGNISCVQPHHF